MNETFLIGKSEKFLSKIQKEDLNFSQVSELDGFIKIYHKLNLNLKELHKLSKNMESKGYKAPYRSLTRFPSTAPEELMVEEIHEASRHSQYFRMKAAAKKNIFDRVKSSISSHKIAIGNLEEYGTIKCKSCSKQYPVFEINLPEALCSCGSRLVLEINKSRVWRLSILPYLPLSGDYMVKLSQLSSWGRESFKKIIKVLKQERKGLIKTISLVIRVMESGRWIRKRITIDVDDNFNYESELRNKYGSNMRIEFLQFHREKPAIINDRHTRTALALAYVQFAEEVVDSIQDKIYSHYLQNRENLELYDNLVLESRSIKSDLLDETGPTEEIQKEQLRLLLANKGLVHKSGVLKRTLTQDLKIRTWIHKKVFPGIAITLVIWDLIKYYLTNSYDRRKKFSGPFPYLRPKLDRNQLQVFQEFDEEVVEVLKIFIREKIEFIPEVQDILAQKFDLEQKMKGLNMKIDPAAFGAALVNLKSGIPLERCIVLFSVGMEKIEAEKVNIETITRPGSKKAQKFLEMISQ